MKFNSIFLSSILFGLLACGPSSKHQSNIDFSQWPQGPVQEWNGHRICLPDSLLITNQQGIASLDTARLAKLMNAVITQITFWEEDNQVKLPPTLIGITDTFNLNCDGAEGGSQGCWRGENVVIVCTGGAEPGWPPYDDTAWPLYHELCHRYYHLIGHADSRWSEWNLKMLNIRAWLDNLRSKP